MGVFWHVAVLKKQSQVDVQEVLKELAAGENEFELELSACSAVECDAGVIIGFNDFCLAFDRLAKALSEKFEGPVLVCDIYDVHDYEQEPEIFRAKYAPLAAGGEAYDPFPKRQHYEGQPYFVSEYGGTWWNPHPEDGDNWGYGNRPDSEQEVLRRFCGLAAALLENPAVCALCYTQLTDVEQEQNGLYAYDRSRKFSDEVYAKMKEAMSAKAAIEG